MTDNRPLRIFEPQRDAWPAALLGLTMLAVAATEGVGLMLIAPLLMALGAADGQPGVMGAILAPLGLTISPAPMLAIFVILVLVRGGIVHLRNMASLRFETGLVDGLRNRAWSALLHCDWRTLSGMRHSRNASLLISDLERIGDGVSSAIATLANATTIAAVCAAGLAMSPAITLAAGLAGLLVLLAYRGMHRKAGRLGEQLSRGFDNIHTVTTEGLGALRVIKSFGKEGDSLARFSDSFVDLRKAQRAYLRDTDIAQIGLQSAGSLLLAVAVWLAIDRWDAAPATILPLIVLFVRALPLLGSVQSSWQNWAHCRPAISAALGLIGQAEAAREPDADGMAPPHLARQIAFEAVTVHFSGREESALDTISLTIPARQITALAGPSGAGKSTLADLAGGLTTPDKGRILIDGVALDGGLRRAWRSRVAYVQQEPVLFTGTIRSNLLWGDAAAGEADLRQALADASALFVDALPGGLDTPVGEHGRQLSGGERQRVVLARALLRKPELLILDEATSALDRGNEEAIALAISRLRGRLTILIIGHKGALQAIADHVISLESGKITVASGRPQGL